MATLDVVIPVLNEEADLAASVERVRGAPAHAALVVPGDDRRQRQHRRHRGGRPPPRPRVRRGARGAPGGEGPRAGPAQGVDRVGVAGARLHGRRPVHRPQRAAAAGRSAAVSGHSDLAIGSRLPARLAGLTGPEAGADLARLQPPGARHAAHPVLRRAVRVQGDPRRRGQGAAAAGGGQRLVLRHRAAGRGRACGPAHPRGAGGLGRRPGQSRRHRAHRAGRRARHRPPRPQPGARPDPAARGVRAARAGECRRRGRPARHAGGDVRAGRRRVDRWPTACSTSGSAARSRRRPPTCWPCS